MAQCGITTKDNPFDFFKDFDAWYQFDESHGYHTMEWLARIVPQSEGLFPEDDEEAYEKGIDDIIRLDPFKRYIKVFKE